jgi:hypothetical protein
MDTFFSSNPGMGSRVAHHIHFPDYDIDELLQITELMLEQQSYKFGEGGDAAFREYLERRIHRPRFAHGRSVRNALDRSRLRQANRLFDQGDKVLTREDLMTIIPDDILKSSVFDEDREADTSAPAA